MFGRSTLADRATTIGTQDSTPRGVVLLVILGMLAALALFGLFMLSQTGQEARSSENYRVSFQTPRADLDPNILMLEALSQLIADTNNRHSALRGHSLLRDLYGNNNDAPQPGPDGFLGTADDIPPNGVIDIIEYFQRAFDGTGDAGEDGIVGTADDFDFNYVYNGRIPEYWWNGSRWVRGGGADESYDYPDHNNMFLAAVRAHGDVLVGSFHRPGYLQASDWTDMSNSPGVGRRIMLRPRGSFGSDGKPGQAGVDDDGNGVIDDISERGWPGSDDSGEHPAFGPGNLTAAGAYDVDNMGFGRADSVWLDLGFPVQRTADGRKFKPLFAFLVIDLDGKLNLNAHGNLTADKINEASGSFQFPNASGDTPSVPDSHTDLAPGNNWGTGALVPFNVDLVMGSGASVTEVNLQVPFSPLFFPTVVPSSGNGPREYRWLLEGRQVQFPNGTVAVPGRWGEASLIGTATPPRAGATYTDSSGMAAVGPYDDNSPGAFPAGRGNYNEGLRSTDPSGGLYGTPPDFDGDGTRGLIQIQPGDWGRRLVYGPSVASQPNLGCGGPAVGWSGMGETGLGEGLDEAAEMYLYAALSTDAPFGPAEAELLYRFEDIDANLLIGTVSGGMPANRLALLAPSLFDSNPMNRRRRFMLTPASWDLAGFNMFPLIPRESSDPNAAAWQIGRVNGSFPDMLREPPDQQYGSLLAEAIRNGRRLNIAPQLRTYAEKQRFFHDLYILMLEVCGPNVPADRVAQWAANVVDFCDTEVGNTDPNAEEVYTPYEFDNDPLVVSAVPNPVTDGWGVDGNHLDTSGDQQSGDSDVVWGAEEPRVIISETLAYEDDMDGATRIWIELYNLSDKTVELNGPNKTYELVIDERLASDQDQYEPSDVTSNRLLFDKPPCPSLPPGGYLVVQARKADGTAEPIPAKLGGQFPGAIVYTPDPGVAFRPSGSGEFRLYLRRLANPYQPEADTATRDGFPRAANPYITIDALDVDVYTAARFGDPDPTVYGTVTSNERVSLSVYYESHPPAAVADGPTHTIGKRNDKATAPLPRFPFLNRPFASAMELMLVPGVAQQHLTTAYFAPPPTANLYTGKDTAGGGDDTTFLVTGEPRTSAFKNSDNDYLYGHLLNFFREDPSGAITKSSKGKGKGIGKGKAKGIRKRRTNSFAPMPGYYRLLEFVEVPSRMSGSRDPNIGDAPGGTAGRNRLDVVPGKMNLNSMWEQEHAQALCNNHPLSMDSSASSWYVGNIPGLDLSGGLPAPYAAGANPEQGDVTAELWRRILVSIANPVTSPDPTGTVPGGDGVLFTKDDRPFQSLSIGLPQQGGGPPPLPPPVLGTNYRPTIHSTLLRGLSLGGSSRPIFADDRGMKTADSPNPPPGLTGPPTDPNGPRDLAGYPQFQFELYQKIANSVTTRSNVYAVWVTVGFFEVLDENPNRLAAAGITNAPPELGAEINADIGQNVRHRGFFIIDRSRARGYAGPPRNSAELQDILSQVLVHSRIIE